MKKACCPDRRWIYLTGETGESCRRRRQRLYAEIALMLSANTPIVPTHSATAPLPALNTSNSWLLHKLRCQQDSRRHASSSPSGWRLPFLLCLTFNFTSNLTLYVLDLVREMNNNAIRTHPFSSRSTDFNYPVLRAIRHQLASTTAMVNVYIFFQLTSPVAPRYCFSYFSRLGCWLECADINSYT